jgi:hypothetical protein
VKAAASALAAQTAEQVRSGVGDGLITQSSRLQISDQPAVHSSVKSLQAFGLTLTQVAHFTSGGGLQVDK